MNLFAPLAVILGFACLSAAAVYAILTGIAQLAWCWPRTFGDCRELPAVTLLKPLCGAEPGLYEDLKSFCIQEYPDYEIVFGVLNHNDPAYDVARRLAQEFPDLPITVVANPTLHGSNLKISNLLNMLPFARHEFLVLADSDAFVEPDYLRSVAPPLCDPKVGLVTCIYRGVPTPGIWSHLGAMYVNEWYMPSVRLAWLFGHQGYVSGQTLCIRRDTLRALGGFEKLSNHLADDNLLGGLVRRLGLEVRLSHYGVCAEHHEPSVNSLIRHEIRWMKTLRVLRPHSFRLLFLTFTLPLAAAGFGLMIVAGPSPLELATAKLFAGLALVSRLTVLLSDRTGRHRMLAGLCLLPVRDLLLCWVWMRGFFISTVTWRGRDFSVDTDGVLHRVS